ncbi:MULTISPECIES: hypothetical protein [Vibrio]|uniref:hypothetical protein n=1 Tax=Vibrio TaxID=662 RepID=UPI0010552D3A|nr:MULTISPECIES: hypothetical protein [unclassified Vibrio]TKE73061.1 hypothetical protein FCV45_05080 [Vibrio sp. F12]TKE79898.1 hypothetical protein FCV56_16080 [Vibrio sp. F12]TKE80347.1 hypothetical protein FCV54_14755 [Vibrio sp. F12]TKF03116.1 hypothetical protein FCV61_00965 [Vibrio sp. F12]
MSRSIVLFFICLISLSASANSNFGTKNITKIIAHDSGNIFVYFSGETTHSENCDSKSTYVLPKENIFFKEMYSGLLASMHSGAKVSGWVNGCYNVWGNTKTKITRLDFIPRS